MPLTQKQIKRKIGVIKVYLSSLEGQHILYFTEVLLKNVIYIYTFTYISLKFSIILLKIEFFIAVD
jgi:hypothetical protein